MEQVNKAGRMALGAAILASSAIALAPPALANDDALAVSFDKNVYEANETWVLTISGTVGTPGFLLFDSSPGPINVPGIGLFEVGLTPDLVVLPIPPIPVEGFLQITSEARCLFVGTPAYVQALNFSSTGAICLSQGDALIIQDTFDVCSMPPCTGRMGDFVWLEMDGDNLQSENEPGIEGVDLLLCDDTGAVIAVTTTDSMGFYEFTGLCPGDYTVKVDPTTVPPELAPVICEVGDDETVDSNCQPARVVLEFPDDEDDDSDFGYAVCDECKGGVVALSVAYTGETAGNLVVTSGNVTHFDGPVQTGDTLNLFGTENDGKFDKNDVTFEIDEEEVAEFHVSCSQPIGPGTTDGPFVVLAAVSKDKGPVCAEGPDDCDLGKPIALEFRYTGEDCSATFEFQDDDKVSCSGDPASADPVHIVAFKDNDVWFDGIVGLNETFVMDPANAGEDKFASQTFVNIFDLDGNLLQEIEFHTSCSQPLAVGNQFGAILLEVFTPEP